MPDQTDKSNRIKRKTIIGLIGPENHKSGSTYPADYHLVCILPADDAQAEYPLVYDLSLIHISC